MSAQNLDAPDISSIRRLWERDLEEDVQEVFAAHERVFQTMRDSDEDDS